MARGNAVNKENTNRYNKEQKEEFKNEMVKARGKYGNIKKVPDTLRYDEQKKLYKWLIKELGTDKEDCLVGNIDVPLLERTVECLYILRKCMDEINEHGVLVSGADKYGNPIPKENPAIKIHKDYLTKYGQLCNQLGLSPSARASLTQKKIDDKSREQDEVLKILNDED